MKKTLLLMLLALFTFTVQAQQDDASAVITEQPEGTLKLYTRVDGSYLYNYWELEEMKQKQRVVTTVWANDGKTVYIKDPAYGETFGAWVKGTISGSTLTIPAGQYLEKVTEIDEDTKEPYSYGTMLAFIKNFKTDADGYLLEDGGYEVDYKTDIVYSIEGNQLKLTGTSATIGLSTIYDDTEEWASRYCEFGTVLQLLDEKPLEVPAELQIENYSCVYGGQSGQAVQMVKVGITDTDVYIQGISADMPEAWVRGTRSGNTVTFSGAQFAGIFGNVAEYWVPGKAVWGYDEEYGYEHYTYEIADKLEMTFDPNAKTLTTVATEGYDATLILNGKKDEVWELDLYELPTLRPFSDVAATPADPTINYFDVYRDNYGELRFRHRYFDIDGNPIDYNKLSYQIYVNNDQPYVFKADAYNLETDMAEMPAMFYDYNAYDFSNNLFGRHTIYFCETAFDRIGVQAIYRGGSEERRSQIVYIKVEAEEDGIIGVQAAPVSTEFFDLQGRRINGQTAKGRIVVRRTTGADGTRHSVKVVR